MITLGSEGEQLTVLLPVGADFVVTLQATDPWPAGTEITLQLTAGTGDPVTWTAVITGNTAVFNVPANEVAPLISGRYSTARLYYQATGGGTLLWGHGSVRVI